MLSVSIGFCQGNDQWLCAIAFFMFRWKVTDGIELQLLEQCRAEALFALTETNRQYLRRWLLWVDSTRSAADTSKFIASAMQQSVDNRGFIACIWHRGMLCGVIGHHGMDQANRATSLGYWLDAAHQGKGIVTACCRAVVAHAFTELKLHRIVIRCAKGNRRSRAIPERLGFSFEGVARQSEWLYDHFEDLAVYSLLQTDSPGLYKQP
jgi:ribosomal-protein-serine acetyltransferase